MAHLTLLQTPLHLPESCGSSEPAPFWKYLQLSVAQGVDACSTGPSPMHVGCFPDRPLKALGGQGELGFS